jgi:Protein of unknown function (DUF3300)
MKRTFCFLLVLGSSFGFGLAHAAEAAAETASAPAAATPAPPPSAPAQRSAAELEKLVMPIALYPDPLIAVVLPASVYPVEIVQAARFVKDTNNLPLVDQQPWDENVKSVAKFPDLIAKMDADLTWTVSLGQAFLEQRQELMDTIQALRARAQKAGTLQTTPQQVVTVTNTVVEKTVEQQVVVVTNTVVEIQPANPQVIYVPTYPPTVYYPPPTYVYDPYAPLVTFGIGMAVGFIIADNHCDWHHGDVDVNYNTTVNRNVNRNVNRGENINRGERPGNRPASPGARPTPQKWQPDQNRLRTSGAPPSAQTREARGWGGAGAQPAQRPATAGAAARPSQLPATGAGGARPAAQPSYNWSQRPAASQQPARSPGASAAQRPATTAGGARSTGAGQQPPASRPAPSSSVNRPSPQPSSAFSGVNNGSSARNFSNRGAASRGGGGRGGGRR